MADFELYNIQNLPILMGNPQIVAKDKGYPAAVYSFGTGRQTGSQTRLDFSQPLTYAGETTIDNQVYDLFRLPESGIEGKDLFNYEQPLYLMLGIEEEFSDVWFLYRPRDRKTHTVKKVFNRRN